MMGPPEREGGPDLTSPDPSPHGSPAEDHDSANGTHRSTGTIDAVYGPRSLKPPKRRTKPAAVSTKPTRTRRTKGELAAIDAAIVDIVAIDAPMTLRSVYYKVCGLGLAPKNNASYEMVMRRCTALRRAKHLSWSSITDGTRYILKPDSYESLEEAAETWAAAYRRNLWSTSDYAVQVFTEKDALTGVLEPITAKWDVALGITRGSTGEGFAHIVASSLYPYRENVLVQFGDWDPSGVALWQSFQRQVRAAADERYPQHVAISFERLAVTADQIDEYDLDMRPTKPGLDKVSLEWVGGSCEVDQIDTGELRRILNEFITDYVDPHQLAVTLAVEESERSIVRALMFGRGAP